MRLSPGQRLGPYEILAPLGAGGMGEVYRARDTRLGREVAIKVLPEEFFEDKERKGRFEREARLLAAVVGALHVLASAAALAQLQMPDPKMMSGIPRPVTDLPDSSISVRLIRGWNPISLPRADELSLDPSGLLFALLISALTALLFGLAPALQATRTEQHEALRDAGARGGGEGAGRARLRNMLVIGEIALAIVLLAGAGLLMESLRQLLSVDPGFTDAKTRQFDLPADNALQRARPKFAMPPWKEMGRVQAAGD